GQAIRLKKVRSISGVNVIGVMSSPRGCPHGRCAFCPMERGFPMSYTSGEPAAMRGFQAGYDPYKQITGRIEQLRAIGHIPSKVELVIQGGTFLAAPVEYQDHFVKRCLDSLTGIDASSLEEAKRNAELSEIRNVGLTIETKPDWCKQPHIDEMLRFGATRVEIGVQIIDDDIYALTNRGHTVEDVVEAFQLAKDAGLKIVAHMMPGLPGSSFQKDLDSFKQLFDDPRFRPDMMKIYPCLVMEGTELYDWWKQGSYQAFETEQAVELIARVKEFVPPWVRIMRVHREFPVQLIIAGVKSGNLRELALQRVRENGKRCRCIRCREIGHRAMRESLNVDAGRVQEVVREYDATEGKEFFIAMEETEADVLIGYLRLRIPSKKAHRPEITSSTAIVRELHVYGPEVPVGRRYHGAWQHSGLGRMLLSSAERKALDTGAKRILVLSAIGTREYYERAGYSPVGPYMGKQLN
ncbi:MAG TPA: tRNA uridine(34) 5-carboxymethylaminomethyl modification radical SAM/GNAT enzyme Elp3, partial [Candidatus Acidoferrales bacterium]|nr:tRNA uridine(34) 5-carboxymethylaminomethyl modification radical SAM/GNAT enzyme Elp3 [Candidatus Acidoferrales bacterium]